MTKRLNVAAMQNELSSSAFFQQPDFQLNGASESRANVDTPQRATAPTEARANVPTPVRPNNRTPERRSLTRCSFELFKDQIDVLRRAALEEKLRGEAGSMSEMVREAIDSYLARSEKNAT
jgi:hypothetical protein